MTDEQLRKWNCMCDEAANGPSGNTESFHLEVCEELAEDLMMYARQVENVACPICLGRGHRSYPNTATWHRGGISGQAFTDDICDECWGSGRTDKKGADLRKIDREISKLKNEVSLRYFADKIGGSMESMKVNLLKVADKLQKARWKDFWEGHAGHCVEQAIRKAIEFKDDE